MLRINVIETFNVRWRRAMFSHDIVKMTAEHAQMQMQTYIFFTAEPCEAIFYLTSTDFHSGFI